MVKDEEARRWTDAPGAFGEAVAASTLEHEQRARGRGLEGLVLRYG